MSRQSSLSLFMSALSMAFVEGLRKTPLWVLLMLVTTIACYVCSPKVMLCVAFVVAFGAVLRAGKFKERYAKLVKSQENEDEDESE